MKAKVCLTLFALLLVGTSMCSGQTLLDCVKNNAQFSDFASFFNFSEASSFLSSASGTLFAFRNGVSVSGASGFSTNDKLNNLRYLVATTAATVSSHSQQAKVSTYLVDPTFVNLGGDAQVVVVNKPSGQTQFYLDGYAAISTADFACGSNYINLLESFVYMPAIVTDVLNVNLAAYQVSTYLNLVNSNNLNNTLNGSKRTVLVPNNAAFTSAGSVSASQLTQLVLSSPVYSNSLTTTAYNVKSVDGTTVSLIKTSSGAVTVTIGSKTVNVVRSDVLSRGGVIHIVDGVPPLAPTSTGTGSGTDSNPNAAVSFAQGNILVTFVLSFAAIFIASALF